ncbi:MAG: biopolymer transporter ExbD [Candidatus Firestonebacteria bacterium]|nr:biopolymer transporter ExbD [Candidatus Firestonebacteria bacterium]
MSMAANDKGAITDINVTPLVDVSLVLVIIFMVTAPMVMQAGIIVASSKVDAAEGQVTQNESVSLRLTAKGIYLNDLGVTLESLPALMTAKLKVNKKKVVTISSDDDVKHGVVVEVLDIAKQSGAVGLSIMKKPAPGKLDPVKGKKKKR